MQMILEAVFCRLNDASSVQYTFIFFFFFLFFFFFIFLLYIYACLKETSVAPRSAQPGALPTPCQPLGIRPLRRSPAAFKAFPCRPMGADY